MVTVADTGEMDREGASTLGSAPKLITDLPGPKARAAIERDQKVTSTSYTRDMPLVVQRGRGCVIEDVDGNLFLDFAAGIAVCATGHAHPKVVAAIQAQAAEFIHICGSDFYYEPMIALCEKLAAIAPGDSKKRVFLTNSGTEAIEAAIKLSRQTTGRQWLVAFHGAFHGRTMGALSLTSSKIRQKRGFSPLLPMVAHATYGDIAALNDLFQRQADPQEIAAIFVEAPQGEGGYVMPPRNFMQNLRALCSEHGILLVCDEIQSGMGRTGKMFACEHYDVVPDILCIAKGIASGMPIGAIVASEAIMKWPPGAHGSTYGGNPLCCAAALATIDLIEGGYMANAEHIGGVLRTRLSTIARRRPTITNVRGLGLMTAVSVFAGPSKDSQALRNAIALEAFRRGLIILGCGESSLRFAPPLCITEQELSTGLDVFQEAVEAATA